ncbi:MAG: hypothetical protein KF805_08725 [Phycisphaeraceae bacterium]|nr:hypothetical protein [Phycisphaeraceae bacterium]
MHRLVRSIRLSGILAAACLTLLSGLALVWFFVQPETLPLLSTWQLAAILAAVVLPGLCLGAWQADRQASAQVPRASAKRGASAAQDPLRTPATFSRSESPAPKTAPARLDAGPEPLLPVGRLSPGGRSIRADRSIHRHRRSARV